MGRFFGATAFAVAAFTSTVLADAPKCGPGVLCPASAPCCSAYGQCGVGAYCLGGCDPLFSHALNSCVPNPTCKSQTYSMDSLNDVSDISKYLGDNTKAKWQVSGKPLVLPGQGILLTMPPDTVGTLMASNDYVWYGKICAKMTTSQGKGVVTAFIMMSDVKDEIDFEWVGTDVGHVQSNYYSQGVTNYNNGANLTASDTASSVHEYCIDWKQDSITWQVDGNNMRVKNRKDTWNSTSNRYDFPQTPSRVMLSLWPAGLPSNAKGTVDWAGGLIDWNSQYMKNGYYYALVQSVTVECYDPPSGTKFSSGSKAYVYTDKAGTNNTVGGTNNIVVLKSLLATGENPNYDPNGSSSSASAKASAAPETVPGVSGAGARGDGTDGSSSTDSAASGAASGSSNSGTSSGSSSSFTQGNGMSGSGTSAASRSDVGTSGSVFAVLVAVVGLLFL